jgi:uncharacterized membrane protein YgdD (TMEM256/DUF423 family)
MPKQAKVNARRGWVLVAALAGMTGVALGAFGAHSLKDILNAAETTLWSKAVFYHLTHAVALLTVVLHAKGSARSCYRHTLWGFSMGILFFSGSLYLMALTDWRWLAWLTPIGGLLFLWGWLGLIMQDLGRQ